MRKPSHQMPEYIPAKGLLPELHGCEHGYQAAPHEPFDGRARRGYAGTGADRRKFMAKLALVYGMRLFPSEELGEVKEATVVLKNGRTARVTMHLIEGSKDEIEATFRESTEAFFEMYPEI